MGKRKPDRCEIKDCICRGKRPARIFVSEVIGDGAWRVGICGPAARALGIKEGGTLPDPDEVDRLLGRRRRT